MKELSELGIRLEPGYGNDLAFTLEEDSLFHPVEHKILSALTDICCLRCIKMRYNGKIQLYYPVGDLTPFSAILPTLDAESLLTVVADLLAAVVQVQNNGFITCKNLDIAFHHIFVDPGSRRVKLLYLPLTNPLHVDNYIVERELCNSLSGMFRSHPALSPVYAHILAEVFLNSDYSLDDLCAELKESTAESARSPELKLVSTDTHHSISIVVNKDRFVIGKHPATVDGVITLSKSISRRHCRIDRHADRFTITDLQSTNGTFVNRKKLTADQPHPLCHGDAVRLADCDFQVELL